MTQKVILSLSCTGLRDADVFSKSDPLVTIFDDFNNELGRTECIDNELNPVFKETISLDYDPYEEQKLIFKVWDIDDYNNDINKADFLGEAQCTLEELVDCPNFSKPLRYEGADFGKIYIKTEKVKVTQNQKGGKKGKKGKKGGNKKNTIQLVSNDSSWIKKEEDTMAAEDTFKSVKEEPEEYDEIKIGLSDTMLTEAFTPGRLTPTELDNAPVAAENENTVPQFTPVTHPLRQRAGQDGYLSDPGFESINNSNFQPGSKPYHFIPSRTSLYDMSLTPLEEISVISPQAEEDGSTVKKRPSPPQRDDNPDDTFSHLTGEYLSVYEEADTYDQLKGGGVKETAGGITHAATSPISPTYGHTIETQTGRSLMDPTSPSHYSNGSPVQQQWASPTPNNNRYSSAEIASPPPHPPSLHDIPKCPSNNELRWCQYSSSNDSVGLWTSAKQDESADQTLFYSFNDTNKRPVSSRRPPVLLDFEETWENVLVDNNSPDWTAVQPSQWRTWFEFYKANSKVKKMRSLLVTTMMGTRECVMRGFYSDDTKHTLHQLPAVESAMLVEDKSILQQPPPSRFPSTQINIINADPVQVCAHLQKSSYKPALFIPASSREPGGEWRTGGIGPLEEFIRRSNYYTCIDNIDGPVKSKKRSGNLGLLSQTECQANSNVTVFRDSQQRNYMFLSEPHLIDVFSITPLPKAKRPANSPGCLTKEEVHLLKRKLGILFCTAAAQGSDCLILTPHLTEGRRVPHRHIAQTIQSVVLKYSGMFKRVIVAVERDVIFHDFSKEVLGVYNKVFPEGQITLPSLPPLPTSQDIVLWHWMGDNNNWYPYDPKQNEVIDAIFLRGESKMSMKGADSAHPGYVVEFNHFTVKSLSSSASRKIGRFKLVYDRIVKKSATRPVGNWITAGEDSSKLYSTAGEELTPQQQHSVAVWQWLQDDNTWAEYSTEQSNKLETAYLQHGTACVILNIMDTRFSVNTKSRIQTNTSTGKQRKVQRCMRPSNASPRATSTPTPPSVKEKINMTKDVVWEHQGADKTWLPFDCATTELLEKAFAENKRAVTVVFNNQAYWIYLNPYNILVDPHIMEEYAIRRDVRQCEGVKPVKLFQDTAPPPSSPPPCTPAQAYKPMVTPMSNSTMIEQAEPVRENTALFTTASDFNSVLGDIKVGVKPADPRQRSSSSDSVKYDANNNRMIKTFMRHPSVATHIKTNSDIPPIHRTTSIASTVTSRETSSSTSVATRDPSREFAWEWADRRTGLWHTLPEFISCFLEPASKTQSHGGVRTSKLTNGEHQITVRADFHSNTITGHLPGRPDIITPLRRVEICSRYS